MTMEQQAKSKPEPTYFIKIEREEAHDFYAENIEESAGTFVCWHQRSYLGNINYPKHDEYLENHTEGSISFPVYIYDHSGISLSTEPFGCPWDSGVVGKWVFTREDLEKEMWCESLGEFDLKKAKVEAHEYVKSMVSTLNDILQGEVWYFALHKQDPNCSCCGMQPPSEVIDSCGGFIGSEDDLQESIKSHIPEEHHHLVAEAWENRYE